MGGKGKAPDPVTSFLGALCGCLLLSLQITARARQVTIANATVSAQKANERGFVKTIEVDLTVYSNAPEEKLRHSRRACGKGLLRAGIIEDSIEYRLNLAIQPAA